MKNNTRKHLDANSWIEPPTLKTLKQDPFDPEVTIITAEIRYKGTNLIGVGLDTFQHVSGDLVQLPRHIAEYKRLTKIYDDKYGELDALREQLANVVSYQNNWQDKNKSKPPANVPIVLAVFHNEHLKDYVLAEYDAKRNQFYHPVYKRYFSDAETYLWMQLTPPGKREGQE